MSVWESIDELLDDDNALTTTATSNTYNSSQTTKESLTTNKDQLMNEDELDQDELLGLIGEERNDDFWNDEQVDAVEIDINEQIDEPLVETVATVNEQKPVESQAHIEQSKKSNETVKTVAESSKENESKVNVVKSEKASQNERPIDQQKPVRTENHAKSHNVDNSFKQTPSSASQTSQSLNKNKTSGQHTNKSQFDANKRNENNKNRSVASNQTLPLPNPKSFNPSEHGPTTVQMRKSFPSTGTVPSVSSSTSQNQSHANISTISSSSSVSVSNPNQPFLFNKLPTNGPMNPPNTALMPTPPSFMNNNSNTFQPHFQQPVPNQLAPMPQYSMMNSVPTMGLGQPSQGLLGHPPQPFMHNPLQTSRDFLQSQYNPYNMNPMSNGNNGGAFMNNQAVMTHNLLPQPLMNNPSPINNGNKHLAENYMSSTSTSFQYSNGSNGINANMMMINQHQAAPVISQMNQLKPNSIYINPSFSKKNSFDQHEQRPLEKQSSNSLPVEKRDDDVAKKKPKKDRKELELLLEKRLAAELAEEKTHENENVSTTTKTSSNSHSAPTKRKSDQSRNEQGSTHRTHETDSNNGQKSKKYQRDERRDEQDEAKRKRLSQTPTSKPVVNSQSKTNESKTVKESSLKPVEMQRKDTEAKVEKKETKIESLFVDDEYARKLEEQKRKREQILREKEAKRNQRINELKLGQKDSSNTITSTNPAVQRKLELKEQVKEVESKKIVKTIGNRLKKTF